MFDEKKGVEKVNIQRSWIVFILLFVFLVAGCTGTGGEGDIDQAEEKKIKEKAIQYIKDTYNKEFEVSEVNKGHAAGLIRVRGFVKDGKDTEATVFWKKEEEMDDTYLTELWTKELTPRIKDMLNKHMSVRSVDHVSYNDGTAKDTRYTGNIPSIFDVLKNGGNEKYILEVTGEIYENGGQTPENIKSFLKELRDMNFHEIGFEFHVYDDRLNADLAKDENKYLLYRYNIHIPNIQKVNIENLDLDQYKTVIQH
ncbi:hypothetical protein AYX07_01040 [Thermoactinomyces sp. AS95]|nr:hypothetical protein JS81_14835 [Thermoactinomyces sp. Gus2-1]KYQ87321.1 hypothetical protein AYX07_01040 [Thermoactinomyces sp. AS95]